MNAVMMYVKSILVGATASVITVIVFKVIAASIMIFFPEVARRIFPGSYHTLGWGGYFALELVGAQALIVGVFAFVLAFVWMSRSASARM
jgi:hypothetical protein